MAEPRVRQFEERYAVRIEQQLGFGRDGTVVYTAKPSAVKFFDQADAFRRERDAYIQLQDLNTFVILGHKVPQLV